MTYIFFEFNTEVEAKLAEFLSAYIICGSVLRSWQDIFEQTIRLLYVFPRLL